MDWCSYPTVAASMTRRTLSFWLLRTMRKLAKHDQIRTFVGRRMQAKAARSKESRSSLEWHILVLILQLKNRVENRLSINLTPDRFPTLFGFLFERDDCIPGPIV